MTAAQADQHTPHEPGQRFSLDWEESGDQHEALTLRLQGPLNLHEVEQHWQQITSRLRRNEADLTIEASGVTECDGAGAGLLLEARRLGDLRGFSVEILGLRENFAKLLNQFDPAGFERVAPQPTERMPMIQQVGASTRELLHDLGKNVTFLGEVSRALAASLPRPHRIRWKEVLVLVERAGVDALPLVGLISFIIGLILAFQASLPMQQFGADIFVANLVTLAMFRELGGLMTAIILAGRSGSAFAAEIGTMKVNEELDALNTLGIDRTRFLVVPRIIAGILVMPLLTIYANACGVLGGFLVMLTLGHTPAAVISQILTINPLQDFFLGFGKAFVFGLVVAAVGCLRGLETGAGASSVGKSTTSAVVTGIFLVILLDGLFAFIFYSLGW
jgi:phospholipid/cholesterol/gamma-HCH transport system permease protein